MQRSGRGEITFWGSVVVASTMVFVACGNDSKSASESSAPPSVTESSTSVEAPTTTVFEDLEMTASDFVNINSMTPVKGYFIDNRLGHLDEAIAVAKNADGGVYPVGTIIQLVPQEAMVKRAPGWNPETNDWEFFFLDVSAAGTTIVTRGAQDTVNRFGGNCASCHAAAEPKFDFVCEDTHGCEPLPIGDDVIASIQAADPRPMP
jgi:hypothetical protein